MVPIKTTTLLEVNWGSTLKYLCGFRQGKNHAWASCKCRSICQTASVLTRPCISLPLHRKALSVFMKHLICRFSQSASSWWAGTSVAGWADWKQCDDLAARSPLAAVWPSGPYYAATFKWWVTLLSAYWATLISHTASLHSSPRASLLNLCLRGRVRERDVTSKTRYLLMQDRGWIMISATIAIILCQIILTPSGTQRSSFKSLKSCQTLVLLVHLQWHTGDADLPSWRDALSRYHLVQDILEQNRKVLLSGAELFPPLKKSDLDVFNKSYLILCWI